MNIATWNVNSLRVRLPHALNWLDAAQPDVLALQETKTVDANFPLAALAGVGYQALFSGQPQYNGVALLAREALGNAVTQLPGLEDDPQRRLLAAHVGDLYIINIYVPNGSEVGSDKYHYKLRWLERLAKFVEQQLATHPRLVLLGDFNIAPADIDVHDPQRWARKILCSNLEREAFQRLLACGLADAFRHLNPQAPGFSWWDYRMNAFKRDLGLRIDHILVSQPLVGELHQCAADPEPRGWERPSDHAPVVVSFQ